MAFDFIMPNHQIVECYIVFTAMEAAKKSEDPDAGAGHTRGSYERETSSYILIFLWLFLLQMSALSYRIMKYSNYGGWKTQPNSTAINLPSSTATRRRATAGTNGCSLSSVFYDLNQSAMHSGTMKHSRVSRHIPETQSSAHFGRHLVWTLRALQLPHKTSHQPLRMRLIMASEGGTYSLHKSMMPRLVCMA